ncbi:MAG: hypothetical protein ACFNPW_03335 [Candidatus Nanosyncoccus sp.]|jgi:hypothetical protein
MNNFSGSEFDLYDPMRKWLDNHLHDKYRGSKNEIIALDTHSYYLDSVLEKFGVLEKYPQTIGLKIQIDVLGIVKWENDAKIFFIEAKKTQLNLHDLGQLWAYCKLCDPEEAYLLSPISLGSLEMLFKNLKREDILDFGDKTHIKKMQIGIWNVNGGFIDQDSLMPKI